MFSGREGQTLESGRHNPPGSFPLCTHRAFVTTCTAATRVRRGESRRGGTTLTKEGGETPPCLVITLVLSCEEEPPKASLNRPYRTTSRTHSHRRSRPARDWFGKGLPQPTVTFSISREAWIQLVEPRWAELFGLQGVPNPHPPLCPLFFVLEGEEVFRENNSFSCVWVNA